MFEGGSFGFIGDGKLEQEVERWKAGTLSVGEGGLIKLRIIVGSGGSNGKMVRLITLNKNFARLMSTVGASDDLVE